MNLSWARELVANWNAAGAGKAGAEKAAAMYTDDAVFQDSATGTKVSGKAALKKLFEGLTDPNAGVHFLTVISYCGGPESGVIEWTWRTKHAADFLGVPAKGRETNVVGVSVLVFKGGRVAEQRDYWDTGAALRQLGAIK